MSRSLRVIEPYTPYTQTGGGRFRTAGVRSQGLKPASPVLAPGDRSQAERHPDRVRSGLGETVTLVQAAPRRVGEQVHVRTRWRCSAYPVQQCNEDRVAQPAPLVLRQHGHVHDVEVPAAIAEQTAHSDDRPRLLVHYVACGPCARQGNSALLLRLRG